MRTIPIIFSTDMIPLIISGEKTQTRRLITPQPIDCSETHRLYKEAEWKNEKINLVESHDKKGYWYCKYCGNGTGHKNDFNGIKCRYGIKNDILYVREKWKLVGWNFEDGWARIEFSDKSIVQFDLPDDDKANDWLVKEFEKLLTKDLIQPSEGCDKDPDDEECLMEFVSDKYHPSSPSIFLPKWCSRIFLVNKNVRAERLQDITGRDILKEGIKEFTKDGKFTRFGLESWEWKTMPRTAREAYRRLWNSLHPPQFQWDKNPWVWAIDYKIGRRCQ